MTNRNDADVYRKAAEIIIRDGKCEGGLTEKGDGDRYIADRSLPVCAMGACYRAHYELYGEFLGLPADPTKVYQYQFSVPWQRMTRIRDTPIYTVNDLNGTSAEDIALLLKRQAEKVDE